MKHPKPGPASLSAREIWSGRQFHASCMFPLSFPSTLILLGITEVFYGYSVTDYKYEGEYCSQCPKLLMDQMYTLCKYDILQKQNLGGIKSRYDCRKHASISKVGITLLN